MRKEAGSTVTVCEGKEGLVLFMMHKEREDSMYVRCDGQLGLANRVP